MIYNNVISLLFYFSSNNVVAESALDRLACGLGGKTILPQVIMNIPNMLNNENWKFR